MLKIANVIPTMQINQVLILNAKYFKRDTNHANKSSIDIKCKIFQT